MAMQECTTVLFRASMMFLVMLAGWWAARRRWVDADSTRAIGVLVVMGTFPALVFTQMLGCVTPESLRHDWPVPLLGMLTLGSAALAGRILLPLFRVPSSAAGTFLFLVAIPNWVYLPLPIAEALYGSRGIRFVLLFNIGAQVMLWTLGPALLAGRNAGRGIGATAGNLGLIAALAGIVIAITVPGAREWGEGQARGILAMVDVIVGALRMLGSLTVPLSLLVAGSQIYANRSFESGGGWPARGVLLGRLCVAPALGIALLLAIRTLTRWHLDPADFTTYVIIAGMPVAVSCTVFVEKYDGDRKLAATGILQTTLASLATVPLFVLLARLLA